MTAAGFQTVIAASAADRRDLFLVTASRLGTTIQNVEKDFWVCWTLDALYNGLPAGSPRLLFKGGTSLSKAFGLIRRFSEDIDLTVFREDLGVPAPVEELEALSGRRRRAKLEAIREACRAFVRGPLRESLGVQLASTLAMAGQQGGRVDMDDGDSDRQSLLVHYPTVAAPDAGYVRPAVRIESGAKSALDPHCQTKVRPYVADDLTNADLEVSGITTIDPAFTFWDKILVAHGLRRWFENRGEVRQEGQRVSRHYYDLHCLLKSDIGPAAVEERQLAAECIQHARVFFDRPDLDLASAAAGSFAVEPDGGLLEALRRDYGNMATMIFGLVPTFDEVLESIRELDRTANRN